MTENQFIPKEGFSLIEKGEVSWQSPSNIALVKYWGKYGEQLPKNASISFTLSNCHTQTKLSFERKKSDGFDFEVFLGGKKEDSFKPKITTFFNRIEKYVPFLTAYKFTIETSNSFPHSSGIASSASGMSALALCFVSIEKELKKTGRSLSVVEMTDEEFNKKASFLARLGSGSACRSVEGPLIVWGEHRKVKESSNLFGTKYPFDIHPIFEDYQDTILLVDKGEKQVSSTVGHNLMHDHPYAEQRFKQADDNLSQLIPVLKEGNLTEFISIVESEALSLHAMMMTSQPYFILMKPNTLEIINCIWNFRKETNSNVCFTLDAGANVHVLYPSKEKEIVQKFIASKLKAFCKNGEYIHDFCGNGATRL